MRGMAGLLLSGICLMALPGAGAAVLPTSGDAGVAAAVAGIDKAAVGHRLILLGEWHGTVQKTPRLAAQLAGRIARDGRVPVVLALEIADDQQPSLDAWLASDGGAEAREELLSNGHWREPNHDGRDSRAMFDMLAAVRDQRQRGLDVRVHAFDHPGAANRDAEMARDVRSLLGRPGVRVIVLTGNVHAMTRRPPWSMVDAHGNAIEPPVSMGRHLADLAPLSIQVTAVRGDFVACLPACKVTALPDRSGKVSAGLQRMAAAGSAWDMASTLPLLTASPPAVAGD